MADAWAKRLHAELQVLPETLAAFREGVTKLSTVAERLETATEVIERSRAYLDESGLGDAARQLDDATSTFRQQLTDASAFASAAAADGVEQAVQAFSDTVEAFFPGRKGQK